MSWAPLKSKYAILAEPVIAEPPKDPDTSSSDEPMPRFNSIFARDAYLASRRRVSGEDSPSGVIQQSAEGAPQAVPASAQPVRASRARKPDAATEQKRKASAFKGKLISKQGVSLESLFPELGNRVRELLVSVASPASRADGPQSGDAPTPDPTPSLLAAVSSRTSHSPNPALWVSGKFEERVLGLFDGLDAHVAFPDRYYTRFGPALASLLTSGPRPLFDPAEPALVEPGLAATCLLPMSEVAISPSLAHDVRRLAAEVFRRPEAAASIARIAMKRLLLYARLDGSKDTKDTLYSWDPSNRFATQLVMDARPDAYIRALEDVFDELKLGSAPFAVPRVTSTFFWILVQPALQRGCVPAGTFAKGSGAKARALECLTGGWGSAGSNQPGDSHDSDGLHDPHAPHNPHAPQAAAGPTSSFVLGTQGCRDMPIMFSPGERGGQRGRDPGDIALAWGDCYVRAWGAYCALLQRGCTALTETVGDPQKHNPQSCTNAFYIMYHYEALAALLYSSGLPGDRDVLLVAKQMLEVLVPLHALLRERTVTFTFPGAIQTRRNASGIILSLSSSLLGVAPDGKLSSAKHGEYLTFRDLENEYFALIRIFASSYLSLADPDILTSPGAVVGRENIISTTRCYLGSVRDYQESRESVAGGQTGEVTKRVEHVKHVKRAKHAKRSQSSGPDYHGLASAVCSNELVATDAILFSELAQVMGDEYDGLAGEFRRLGVSTNILFPAEADTRAVVQQKEGRQQSSQKGRNGGTGRSREHPAPQTPPVVPAGPRKELSRFLVGFPPIPLLLLFLLANILCFVSTRIHFAPVTEAITELRRRRNYFVYKFRRHLRQAKYMLRSR